MHKLGILIRVTHLNNFLEGQLVDFSMAWTMYHFCFDRANAAGMKKLRFRERYTFGQMVDEWASRYQEKIQKPEGLVKWRTREEEDVGFDPRRYDWQEWEDTEKEN
ncbi:hypothetical protein Daus18300_004260 [Diaporthe australafricana]|uniref:Uncharacterized protein n=1 Tax=Diaporthe australafricana TaxID=127596 RepID=A0ABR3XAR1_9PEZI